MGNPNKKIYTLSELAEFYGVDRRTLYNWIKPIRQELLDMYIDPSKKKYLSLLLPKQIKKIREYLD